MNRDGDNEYLREFFEEEDGRFGALTPSIWTMLVIAAVVTLFLLL